MHETTQLCLRLRDAGKDVLADISHTNELSEQSARRIEALATEFMQAFFSAHNIQPEREERELKLDTRTRTNAKPEAGNEQ